MLNFFGDAHRSGMAVALTAGLALAAGGAAAQENWALGTSSSGSGPYVDGTIIAKTMNEGQDVVDVSAQTTGGYNENIALVANGQMEMGMGVASDLHDAYFGTGKYADYPDPDSLKKLRALSSVGLVVCHYVSRADAGIETFEDLKGKTFNLNAPSTFTRGLNENFVEALGMKLSDFDVGSVSTGQFFGAMQDRTVDAGGHCFPIGLGAMQQLANSVDVTILNVPQEAFDRLNEMYDNLLVEIIIPAGTYPGQDEDAKTFALNTMIFTNEDTSEEGVYSIMKGFWENTDGLVEQSQGFAGLTPDLAIKGNRVPLHPGAERYFREIGQIQ
ncbi:TAXI family TRAP transporter solute-binding subunit [Pikeienuella sp. HZG-20]|uniref:TAXI family TRAP transporter solute-binding subunit n=1 Tax=Paludibacillus litoralis TaxID=3133267 RepID=UPI0030EEDB1E